MLDGFGYVFGQIALLLLLAVAIGLLVGRYLLPRQASETPAGDDTSPPAAVTFNTATHAERPPPQQETLPADTRARIAYAETRIAQAEARRAELENRLTEAQTQLARATTGLADLQNQVRHSRSELEQSRGQAAQQQAELAETRRQLTDADAEVVRLRLQAKELADRKETEMGRLESGAIAALESTIATHQEQVTQLEERLKAALNVAEERGHELVIERRRCEQLQSALAERDQHLANLNADTGLNTDHDHPRPTVAPDPERQPESSVSQASEAR